MTRSDHLTVDVRRVVEALGLEPTLIGQELVTLCPFHKERSNPNLEINSESGLWHCWVCGHKGNIVQLIIELSSVSYREAINQLEGYSDVPSVKEVRERNLRELESKLQNLTKPVWPRVDITSYMRGRSWWRSVRGYSAETIQFFDLGYDLRRNRAVIPVRHCGGYIGIIRRATRDTQVPRYLYDADFPKGRMLYAWDYLPESTNRCIIVEGSTDVHRLYSFGYTTSVAVLGTSITVEQQRLISDRFDEVVLFMDNDPAGHIATLRNAEQLSYDIPRVMVVSWDEILKKDPGELSFNEAYQLLDNPVHWSSLLTD